MLRIRALTVGVSQEELIVMERKGLLKMQRQRAASTLSMASKSSPAFETQAAILAM
jgi:hypothetical protein